GVAAEHPEVSIYFDLAELRGYQYHTGMVFAAYVPGYGQALAKGGRYDDTGRAFGRARPATGFSMDLKQLATLAEREPPVNGIWAPDDDSAALTETINHLRAQGERVIQALPGQHTGPGAHRCDRQLAFEAGEWRIAPLN
ncbi:hypothetical protein GY26_03660, partial [Gammaproteobacteria bacterium MFB021]